MCLLAFSCFATGRFWKLGIILEYSRSLAGKYIQSRDAFRAIACEQKYLTDYNRTFLLRFGGISGEFGLAMVRILPRRSQAKIPMARKEPDMLPEPSKKVRLRICRSQIQSKI